MQLTLVDVLRAQYTSPSWETGAFVIVTRSVDALVRRRTGDIADLRAIARIIGSASASVAIEEILASSIGNARRRRTVVFDQQLTGTTGVVRWAHATEIVVVRCSCARALVLARILLARVDGNFTETTFVA